MAEEHNAGQRADEPQGKDPKKQPSSSGKKNLARMLGHPMVWALAALANQLQRVQAAGRKRQCRADNGQGRDDNRHALFTVHTG